MGDLYGIILSAPTGLFCLRIFCNLGLFCLDMLKIECANDYYFRFFPCCWRLRAADEEFNVYFLL